MFKRSLAFAPAVVVLGLGLWIGPKYDRFVLPAFDGHVYDAMAENPRVFTLAPWGYRILEPWIVYLLPVSSAAVGFFWLNLVLLCGAVVVVGWWLRRLGFSSVAAAIAATGFALSPPIRVVLNYQILVDPLALLLLIMILHELVDPDIVVLMALFAAAALTKETGLLTLSLVPMAVARRYGWKRGLLDSLVVATPAIALCVLLRMIWGSPAPPSSFSVLDVTVGRILQSGRALGIAASLSGLLLAAVVGLVREKSVELRAQAILLWFFTISLILLNPYHYSVSDLPRLSVFAWPAMLPLALSGLGFKRRPVETPARSKHLRTIASVLTLLVCVSLVAASDTYRRAPFPEAPDPIAMVGRIRESLKAARALDHGESFSFDARAGRFAAPVDQRFNLTEGRRQRWFLYRGFGTGAAFGSQMPEFKGQAELIIPILVPRVATISIELKAAAGTNIGVIVAGRTLGSVAADGSRATLMMPHEALFRGDNIVRLRGPAGVSVRLLHIEVRLAHLDSRRPERALP